MGLRSVRVIGVEDDACVEGEGLAVGKGDRVDIHLGDLGEIRDKVGKAQDDLLQHLQVGRRFSPIALKELVHPCLFHQLSCQGLVEGRQADGKIPVDLDPYAAHAEEDHRPEILVLFCAENDLVVDLLHHLLDRDPLIEAFGQYARTLPIILTYSSRNSSSELIPSITPPASLL